MDKENVELPCNNSRQKDKPELSNKCFQRILKTWTHHEISVFEGVMRLKKTCFNTWRSIAFVKNVIASIRRGKFSNKDKDNLGRR